MKTSPKHYSELKSGDKIQFFNNLPYTGLPYGKSEKVVATYSHPNTNIKFVDGWEMRTNRTHPIYNNINNRWEWYFIK